MKRAMNRAVSLSPSPPPRSGQRAARAEALPPLQVWAYDGPFERCLADLEDTLRRSIVRLGSAARIVVLIELSLPALKQRVSMGDAVQPAWSRFLERMQGYGLPASPRVRHRLQPGPLATLVIGYRP